MRSDLATNIQSLSIAIRACVVILCQLLVMCSPLPRPAQLPLLPSSLFQPYLRDTVYPLADIDSPVGPMTCVILRVEECKEGGLRVSAALSTARQVLLMKGSANHGTSLAGLGRSIHVPIGPEWTMQGAERTRFPKILLPIDGIVMVSYIIPEIKLNDLASISISGRYSSFPENGLSTEARNLRTDSCIDVWFMADLLLQSRATCAAPVGCSTEGPKW